MLLCIVQTYCCRCDGKDTIFSSCEVHVPFSPCNTIPSTWTHIPEGWVAFVRFDSGTRDHPSFLFCSCDLGSMLLVWQIE